MAQATIADRQDLTLRMSAFSIKLDELEQKIDDPDTVKDKVKGLRNDLAKLNECITN